jgi:lipoate-protein ligase A
MLYVNNNGITDARLNLALEEHVLRNRVENHDLLLFYINAPAIIIGRNQNTIEEINADVVNERGIRVVRRISGGGAVYHDLGNLNFSFMTRDVSARFNRYDLFNRPVVDVLRALGVPAEIGGRNDILVEGRKISGNAQFATAGRMFSHGTLLVDSNLDDVTSALRPKPGKVESKGVKSIRSRVANIAEFLREPISVIELRDRILERIFDTNDRARVPSLTIDEADWRAAQELLERRYGNWNWNFGEDPPCNVQRVERFPAGEIDARLDVHGGRITAARFFGDYMGRAEVSELEALLQGVVYHRESLAAILGNVDVREYFGDIAASDVLALLAP